MSRPVSRLRTRSRLALLVAATAGAALVPTSASAAIAVRDAVAFPMAPYQSAGLTQQQLDDAVGRNRVCSPEPKNHIYGNDAYDSTQPWDVQKNNAGAPDILRDKQAGKSTDWCIGYTMTPNVEELVVGADYDADHAWRVQPATNPFPDDVDTHTWDRDVDVPWEGDDSRDVVIDLPPTVSAAPAGVGTCTDEQFGIGNYLVQQCPTGSQVGDANIRLTAGFGQLAFHAAVNIGRVYNLAPSANEVARLGLYVTVSDGPGIMGLLEGAAPTKVIVRVVMNPDGSGRLRAIVSDIPRQLYPTDNLDAAGHLIIPPTPTNATALYIESVGMRIWGSAAAHPSLPADFAETGTSCTTPDGAVAQVTTYKGVQSSATSAPEALTGCDQLAFDPSVAITGLERAPGVPTGATIDLQLGQQRTAGLRTALLKDAVVRLPAGLEVAAQVASGGLPLCTAAQFDRGSIAPATCPAGTAVGTVAITSPLIDRQLTGRVFLGEQSAVGDLPKLYLEASFPGATAADAPRIKLVGTVEAAANGQLTATFANNPQLRFSRLQLTLRGGADALLVTPRTCSAASGSSTLTPWSGKPATTVTTTVTPDQDCDARPFAPTVSVTSADGRAGGHAPTTIHIERADRSAWLQRIELALPTGFLADLNKASECTDAQAQAAACPAAAQIGTVNVTAGAGAAPTALSGKVFLTERQPGDVAGIAIVVRAKLGDLDLGDVVVRGRIELRPTDAGLTVRADLPTRFKGLPLHLRTVDVKLDRTGFPVAPTACGPLPFSATINGDAGEQAKPAGNMTYTGCKDLGFKPTLKATLTGENKPGGHPGMYVVLTSPEGDAGMKSAAVTLPDGVITDGINIKSACSSEDFAASRCPASTKIGTATATVSITPEPIVGGIYMVNVPGASLPGLGLAFTGRYAQRVLSKTTTDKQDRIAVTFGAIPDLPLRKLVIDVASTPKSPLLISDKEPCAAGSGWEGAFVGQGGQTAASQTGLQCSAVPKVTLSARSGFSLRLFDFGSRKLQSLKATLPAGWSFNAKVAKRSDAVWVRMTGGSATLKVGRRALVATASGQPTDVRLKVSGTALRRGGKVKGAASVPITVRLVFTDGTVQSHTVTVKVKK